MINYHYNADFSLQNSQKRIEKAKSILGPLVVSRIIAFALYILGANRNALAKFLNIPVDTIKSLIKRTNEKGLNALEDQRHKTSSFLPTQTVKSEKPKLIVHTDKLIIYFNGEDQKIELKRENKIQCKTVLLTLLADGLLSYDKVAEALELSFDRIKKLKAKMCQDDVVSLIDQRKGQQKDYLVSAEVKAELIQQFVLNLSNGLSTSSHTLSDDLLERCQIQLAQRTIRLYLDKLGLKQIRQTLPSLLEDQKKT